MQLKLILPIGILLTGLSTQSDANAVMKVGSHECGPYHSRDTRKQPPKTSLTKASIDSSGTGYVLKVTFSDDSRTVAIPLDNQLNLISATAIPYTMDPLDILPNGKFKITILGRTNVCTYSGKAQLSSKAYTRLFGP